MPTRSSSSRETIRLFEPIKPQGKPDIHRVFPQSVTVTSKMKRRITPTAKKDAPSTGLLYLFDYVSRMHDRLRDVENQVAQVKGGMAYRSSTPTFHFSIRGPINKIIKANFPGLKISSSAMMVLNGLAEQYAPKHLVESISPKFISVVYIKRWRGYRGKYAQTFAANLENYLKEIIKEAVSLKSEDKVMANDVRNATVSLGYA